jgi:hypothetical protein
MSVHLDATGGWAHLGWQPSKDGAQHDLSVYSNLDLWIRSASGTVTALQMEMHGPGGGCPWVNITDYLAGGATTWQKVSIPLSAFQLDRTRIQTVDFWLTTGSADFFIDDCTWT